MDNQNQLVSTDAQRLALEAMSAQLVHKLNAMIAEQEERTRTFAEQHHTHIALPQTPEPVAIEPAAPLPEPPPAPRPPSPRQEYSWSHHGEAMEEPDNKPLRIGPKKQTSKPAEENNIGLGMVIFSLIGIVILLRSCS